MPPTKIIEAFRHTEDKRKNIPSSEHESVVGADQKQAVEIRYPRNTDLDPQLMWRGKDQQDWSDLVVHAPPLYIQEKVHPEVLINDLLRESRESRHEAGLLTPDLFSDFNGLPKGADKTEFYKHDQNWTNRMILGDSLSVMASLAEREGLRGKVQCIYFDPPYGIKFNSNFQWSTTSRDVKDGKTDHITREPEQVKAFRDTWRDGIHSYLSYLRDRMTVARDLLTDSGSIFVQIGDENVHRVRALLDEIFGDENYITTIAFVKTGTQTSAILPTNTDQILWYAKRKEIVKARRLFNSDGGWAARATSRWIRLPDGDFSRAEEGMANIWTHRALESTTGSESSRFGIAFEGRNFAPKRGWSSSAIGMRRLSKACRILRVRDNLRFAVALADFPFSYFTSSWADTGTGSFGDEQVYVVQTTTKVIQRCLLMATDPGDLVLDPTCGSGTTATVAEQWGRRWITIDTSRVALALARARIMGAKYPYYLLADSNDGQIKEAEITRTAPSSQPVTNNLRHGFVYERVPHITLKSIANNTEIDVIWDEWQAKLEPLLNSLNKALGKTWEEWEIPREAEEKWSQEAKSIHADWWKARIGRQKEIDASIAAKAEFEYLYDKPYEDKKKVRVAGPFTVESLSPHRMVGLDENDELLDRVREESTRYGQSFAKMVMENLHAAGVQQAHKEDRITFTSVTTWPGHYVCAEGRYMEAGVEKRAGIFIGPEFGTVQRSDLTAAAREAGDAKFDVLIACAFNYEAQATEFSKLGYLPVLKARMNADLHMGGELKSTGKGNLFVVFGEPDIDLLTDTDGRIRVKVKGVDVFKPQTGEVVSDGPEGIACWFIDTDYNEESFFVRHAYFLGANDPYKSLKTTLKADINAEAWETLNSAVSRPFLKPKGQRIAVKVINHLGDEVMKVFKISEP